MVETWLEVFKKWPQLFYLILLAAFFPIIERLLRRFLRRHQVGSTPLQLKMTENQRVTFDDLIRRRLSLQALNLRGEVLATAREGILNEALSVYSFILRHDLVRFDDGDMIFDEAINQRLAENNNAEPEVRITAWDRIRDL